MLEMIYHSCIHAELFGRISNFHLDRNAFDMSVKPHIHHFSLTRANVRAVDVKDFRCDELNM